MPRFQNVRRLLLLASTVVLVDTSFYAAITPLLPYYADHEHLTKTSAGILSGAYPAGTLVASLPAGALAARFGPRALLAAGLMLAGPFSGLPLVVCGVLKIAYDLALLFSFRHIKPPEEMPPK